MKFFSKKIKTRKNGLEESEILGLRKYKEIDILLKRFPYNGKFLEEIEKTKKECVEIFRDSIKTTDKDWDILTLIRLFDQQTYEHSIGTFIIAREKIENALENGVVIKQGIEEEVGEVSVFYRACLFHDVGKITIPKFILKNSLTDKDWALRLYRAMKKQKNKLCFTTKKYLKKYNIFMLADKIANADSPSEILDILKSNKLRPVQIIPLKYGISKRELKRLKRDYRFESDVSLTDLMQVHEKESYNILNSLGYRKEAVIAGNHGNGGQLGLGSKSKAYSSIRMGSRMSDIVDLIYLADVQDSLGNDRYYHKSFTKLKILAFLVSDTRRGVIDKTVSCLWIKDEYEKLKKDKKFQDKIKSIDKKNDNLSEKEEDIIKDLKMLNDFLDSICVIAK